MKKFYIQLIFTVLSVLILAGAFCYYYYVIPQREYIKMEAQQCVDKAMALINDEVIKTEYNHYSKDWFSNPLKQQQSKLDNCTALYFKSILFSGPEKKIFQLALDNLKIEQSAKIVAYNKASEEYKAEIERLRIEAATKINEQNERTRVERVERQNRIEECKQIEIKRESYSNCINENGYFSDKCEQLRIESSTKLYCAFID